MKTPTETDILAALRSVTLVGEEGMTAEELVNETGWGYGKLLRRLKPLILAGSVVVGEGWRTSITGRNIRKPVYQIRKKK